MLSKCKKSFAVKVTVRTAVRTVPASWNKENLNREPHPFKGRTNHRGYHICLCLYISDTRALQGKFGKSSHRDIWNDATYLQGWRGLEGSLSLLASLESVHPRGTMAEQTYVPMYQKIVGIVWLQYASRKCGIPRKEMRDKKMHGDQFSCHSSQPIYTGLPLCQH